MIIPRHRECDFCGKYLGGRRERRYIIKSKVRGLGTIKHDVCSGCMYALEQELEKKREELC